MSSAFDLSDDSPVYVISVAAQLSGLHPQTLRQYDRMGLVQPGRTSGGGRRYSERDVALLREVQRLSQEDGVNLAGIKRIIELEGLVGDLRQRVADLEAEMGLPTGSLQTTVAAYNDGAARGEDPLLHKKPEWLRPIGTPVGAIDLRGNTGGFTLGGLHTSLSAEVLNVSGEPIPGLFAAGRATAGLAAWGYASGVSLGDGSFYGRRAGRAAANS